MNKLLNVLLLSVISFGIILPTYAAEAEGASCKMHQKDADTNKDGSIDKAEMRAMQDKKFEEMDTNKDGVLSKDEMKNCCKHEGKSKAMHEKQTKAFNAADTDHDGTLTKYEAKKLPNVAKNFEAIDGDKDGTLDREEVHHFMHQHNTK